jgi:predicted nucleotidyltransferase
MQHIDEIKNKKVLPIVFDAREALIELFGNKLKQLILFGSYARGEQEPGSDVDIMILVDETEEKLKQYRDRVSEIMTDLSLKYDVLVSLMEKSYDRYMQRLDILPFYRNIYDEGLEIYGRDTNTP